ncbi:uncharacterized protein LOC142092231 [Calonectris borealis]|uniref:uncharacterized protein LOC142092231 n=1 Tax=Calonectris borealis TaxID=1323832 RepID=UPI003F4C728F
MWNSSPLLGTRVVTARAANLTMVPVNHGAVPFLCSRWLSLASNPASGISVFLAPVPVACGVAAAPSPELWVKLEGTRGPREVVQAWPLLRVGPAGMNRRGVLSVSVAGRGCRAGQGPPVSSVDAYRLLLAGRVGKSLVTWKEQFRTSLVFPKGVSLLQLIPSEPCAATSSPCEAGGGEGEAPADFPLPFLPLPAVFFHVLVPHVSSQYPLAVFFPVVPLTPSGCLVSSAPFPSVPPSTASFSLLPPAPLLPSVLLRCLFLRPPFPREGTCVWSSAERCRPVTPGDAARQQIPCAQAFLQTSRRAVGSASTCAPDSRGITYR